MLAHGNSGDQKRPGSGVLQRFRADLAREDLHVWSASFADRELEDAYQRHLINVDLPKIRLIGVVGVVVWYLFGVLDLLTIRENLTEVLIIRGLISGPIVIAIALLIYSERMKRFYGLLTAAGMVVLSFAILAMIHLMPAEGAPPYIIGILVIFAYSSCFNRIAFPVAAGVYVTTALAYALMLQFGGKYSQVDIISGQFFMSNIAGIAVLTHYAQEIRSRQIWRRNRQRALDAAYIEELLIEATAADQSKINFISVLSHELRTPLHQIIGFSEIVRQRVGDKPSDDTRGFVEDIHTSAHELLSRIAKMLRYADATAGKIKYEIEPVSAADLIETVLVQARDKAAAKSIAIDVSGLADQDVLLDHHHTSYAIGHILENAIKATPQGGAIEIRGGLVDNGRYSLSIEDHGAGMDEKQIKEAFEPFSQVEQVRTRSVDGLGLGLTLARKIFHDQAAEMSLASIKGVGTTVSIVFAAPQRAERGAALSA